MTGTIVLIILAVLFCIGYTNYKLKQMKDAINRAFKELQEGLLKIIENGEGAFGDNFKEALTSAIHETIGQLFEEPYEELDKMENVPLMIDVVWEQKDPMVIFDFSKWDAEEKKGVVGVTIYTAMEQPDSVKEMKEEEGEECLPFMYPDATLRYVRDKNDENAIPYWIWDEQFFFMMALDEGFDLEEEEENLRDLTTEAISLCHIFLRESFGNDPSIVSLREIARFTKCVEFFQDYFPKKEFKDKHSINPETQKLYKIKSIICSIYLCYYMRLTKENVSRKIDSLGRVSVPKSLRDRLEIGEGDMVDFFLLENDDRFYVCLSRHVEEDEGYEKYLQVAKLLDELGLEVPKEVAEKL